ncbi:hypothetical protein SESBI_03690 [Sesbania bispinosa]|nr:hypothetical protein SESBI_03690 [Sesbania bispinosa]
MASRYDLIRNVNGGSEHKIWRIKVRVIRLWRSSYFKDNNNKPMIELVVLDEQGGRIQCTVKSIHVYLFENSINEGNVYMLENLSVALNSGKYKPTMHEFRMFFKRETRVTLVEDSSIPLYGFSFVPFVEILNETKDDRRLVDVLGVVTGKGNLIEFKKEGKPCNYVVIELENIEGGLKLRCTLWEDYAFMFLKHLEDHPSESYVVVLQFAKMKNLKNSVFVTIGTVKDIESEYNWCYRACKKCSLGLKLDGSMFYCKKCVTHYSTFVTRYSIQLRVVGETDSASFILFDKEASNFLKIPAYELRTSYIAKGGDKNRHPEEIDSLKIRNSFLKCKLRFKIWSQLFLMSLVFQGFVLKNIIASFEKKYQIEEVALIQDNSELLSQFTESSDLLKYFLISFVMEIRYSKSPFTDWKNDIEYGFKCYKDHSSRCVHGDEQSAKKLRKVIKEEKN